jgi:hypothetical protein
MSRRLKALIPGFGVWLVFVVGSVQGCGSDSGAGSGSGSGWNCVQPAGGGCSCAKGSGGAHSTCTGTYDCCFTFIDQGVPACICANGTAIECSSVQESSNGTPVSRCPPP